eukprot:GCRY01004507.1.p1 GENE.GCRY01004507.1~~GCRY01004507.1.p1  ORF type:complete len:426 (+),score=69.94 GCRY01004507.1:153-1430(+)
MPPKTTRKENIAASFAENEDVDVDLLVDKYNWEGSYERSWEVVQENENGQLINIEEREKRKAVREVKSGVRKGMMRRMYIVLDLSAVMDETDLKPNRASYLCTVLEDFISEFFSQNPLSQLGIIVTRNGKAERIASLSGHRDSLINALRSSLTVVGIPSLQSALMIANVALKHVPDYCTREVFVVYGALNTCDPGNIFDTIEESKALSVRCSVVALSASVAVLGFLASETSGTYEVAANPGHLRELLLAHTLPSPLQKQDAADLLIEMGFPTRTVQGTEVICSCHCEVRTEAHLCPRCNAAVCALPTMCPICSLHLIAAPHLFRSHHHLFPVPPFDPYTPPLPTDESNWPHCASCNCLLFQKVKTAVPSHPTQALSISLRRHQNYIVKPLPQSICPECQCVFCLECDAVMHTEINNCVGCLCKSV